VLKQVIAFVFLTAVAIQTFDRAFIMLDYYTNTSRYAKDCENKAKPQIHCNGKCQMMKKLKQEEKKDQQNPERKSENKKEYVLSSKSFFPVLSEIICEHKIFFLPYRLGNTIKMPRSIFHPPDLIA